ncbi:MAG: PSD1 and planctomycete cytochrome C domain-containing protein [Planctomycetota bacterium]
MRRPSDQPHSLRPPHADALPARPASSSPFRSSVGYLLLSCGLLMHGMALGADLAASDFSDADLEFFETHVRPLLVSKCYDCHGGNERKGGLRLTSRAELLAGGDTGPAIEPGNPADSLLIDAVHYGLYEMPPKSKLAEAEIHHLEEWVRRGAPWPATDALAAPAAGDEFDLEARKARHWAFRELTTPPVPDVEQTDWPHAPLDAFILATLEAKGLRPAAPADPRALVRRAYFDLIGLPPPPEVVEVFAAAPSPEAFAALVDRLLESDHFGERWARHWLDLMRYAESRGHEFDYLVPNAWQYRDYLIRALNADVPYDQFVVEHIAGDLMTTPRRHPDKGFNESLLATGFWFLGEWVHSPVDIRKDEADRFDNAIDVYSKAFLGLTVACARCHDHKFDAISQADYYALVGFLQSSDYRQVRFESMEHNQQVARQLDELHQQTGDAIAQLIASETANARSQLQADLTAALTDATSTPQIRAWREELEKAQADASHPLNRLLDEPPTAVNRDDLVVADFDDPRTTWQSDGPVFRWLRPGSVLPGPDAQRPINALITRGCVELALARADLHPADDAEQAQRQANANVDPAKRLRLPARTISQGKIYYYLSGAAQIHAVVDSHRMIDGPLHRTTFQVIEFQEGPRWVEQDLTRYIGHGVVIEVSALKDHPLQLFKVVEADQMPADAPHEPLPITSPADVDGWAAQMANRINEAFELWTVAPERLSPGMGRALEWIANRSALWRAGPSPELERSLTNYHQQRAELLKQLMPTSSLAVAICDVGCEDQVLFVRGNAATPSNRVPRRLLTALDEDFPAITSGSGRLQLAERTIASPFVPRVMVNRVWHHLMGRGIVPSVDNFGVLGEPPSHPELLDHLAVQFIDGGWSVKRLIRSLMLSRTYQMSTAVRDREAQIDPNNRLFHRASLRRLQAEPLRDALLALSGSLDTTPFGPSVPVHLTPFMEGRGRPPESGPLDGDGRRSIYLAVRRNFLSPMMLAFDRPQPSSPQGRRTVSNVPAQALILLNDPFVQLQASQWATRLIANHADPQQRLVRMYEEGLSRPPTTAELAVGLAFLETEQQADHSEQQAWTSLCHVLFNTKEFLFLR